MDEVEEGEDAEGSIWRGGGGGGAGEGGGGAWGGAIVEEVEEAEA